MLAPQSLKQIPRYPVTAGIAIAALVVTGLWWSGHNIDPLVMNGQVWTNFELWRALTSTLPHVGILHLAFNLYWVWVFGTLVERIYGHLKCAGIFLLLAFGSSLAEFTLFNGGVGLSGVGYGLWGMLWVLEKRDPRFTGAVDYQTSRLFVFWFFLCVVLTITNIMPVANVAHGVGAGMGALLGLAASSRGAVKWKSIVGLVAVLILGLAGSTVFWPWVNLSGSAEAEVEWAGYQALEQNNAAQAVKYLKIATRMRHASARSWFNLGIAYSRLNQYDNALTAYEYAAQMPDADSKMQREAQDMKIYLTQMKEWRVLKKSSGTNDLPIIPNVQTNQ